MSGSTSDEKTIVGYTLGSSVSGSSLPFLPVLLALFFFG